MATKILAVDLRRYWCKVIRLYEKQDLSKAEQETVFSEQFLPHLRRLAAEQMGKKKRRRSPLSKIMWDTCYEYWGTLTEEPFPFEKAMKCASPSPITRQQNDFLMGPSLSSPDELIEYLDDIRQMPEPRKTRRKASAGLASKPASEPASTGLVTPEYDTTPSKHTPLTDDPGGESGADDRPGCFVKDGHIATKVKKDVTPKSAGLSRSELDTVDHWAHPGRKQNSQYFDAPKLPNCDSWEIPLPPTMDPAVHVAPYLDELYYLTEGMFIRVFEKPLRLKVDLRDTQRSAMLNDETKVLERDYMVSRWKAYQLLLSWVESLSLFRKSSSKMPLNMLEFVRNELWKESDLIRSRVAKKIRGRTGTENMMFLDGNYRLPKPRPNRNITEAQVETITTGTKRKRGQVEDEDTSSGDGNGRKDDNDSNASRAKRFKESGEPLTLSDWEREKICEMFPDLRSWTDEMILLAAAQV